MRFTLAASLCLFLLRAQSQDNDWVVQADEIDPAHYYGVTVANGMIGIVSSADPMRVEAVILNGVYDYYQRGRVSNILETLNPMNVVVEIDGSAVSATNVTNLRQTCDLRKALFKTSFDFGDKVSVSRTVLALRQLPYTALTIVEVTARKSVRMVAGSVIQAPDHLRDVRNYYSEIDRPHATIALLTSMAESPTGRHKVAASNSFIFPEAHGTEPDVIHEEWDYNRHLAKFSKTMVAGETYRFGIVSSMTSTADFGDPMNEAERLTIYASLEGTDRLLNRHQQEWDSLWKSDIVLSGDASVQKAVRFALYHLYSFVRAGTGYSLSPMGLSGLGYNGHVFWDTELWMYPPLLVLHPEIARSLLEYRYQRLDAARRNAKGHGYRGAMFPWESSDSGNEDTPVWALTGPFQHHITGCIGWAFWKYYQVTKDRTWLRERGYPVLKEVADFWASRVERNGPGQFEINNVIGADEWQENIDNNAFTNGMAITVLRYATAAARVLQLEPDPDWEFVARNIPIPAFPDGTTKENDTYQGEEIKQADVNLLAYPLEIITDRARVERDLSYYEPRMSPRGPAMGNSVLATLHARLGDAAGAYDLFIKSYKPNEVPPFGVLAETAGGTNPYFATGAGGMLQAVLFGFGGLNISDEGITQLKTKLPKNWTSLTVKGVGVEHKEIVVKGN